MAKGLRYEAGRDMPAGMQVAAAKEILARDAGAMLAALMEVDVECRFCSRAEAVLPCADETPVPWCRDCQRSECPCFGCHENSRYTWCGAEEALRRLEALKK